MTDMDFYHKNSHEYKELEDLLRRNEERFNSLLKLINLKGLPEKEFINTVLEECLRLTGSRVGYFHFINQDQNTIQLYTWSKEVKKDCYAEENTHYPLDQAGIWADCVRLKRPVIHNDYEGEKNKKGLPEGHFPVKKHMSIPVFDEDRIVAIVGVGNKEIDYDESDVQQLYLYAKNMWNIIKQNRSEEEIIKLAAIVENSNDAIIGINLDGIINSWNIGAERIYGYLKHEIMNQSISLLYPTKLSKIMVKYIKKLMQGEFIDQFETKNIRKDGEEIFVSLSISTIKALTGVVTGISYITRDITEHKQMEENYRDLYEDAPNAYFSIDKDKSIRQCNKMAENLLGYKKKELLKMKVFDLYAHTQDGLTKAKNIFKIYLKGEFIKDEELQMKKINGDYIWVSLSVSPIKDKEGNIIESRSMVIDITKRKITEQKLKEYQENLELKIDERTNELKASEHELKIIYENAPVLMVLVDEERRVRKANNLVLTFANRSEEDMLGLRGGEALRCLNALNDPQGCGFSSECQLCMVRYTILDTFKTNTSIHDIEVILPFLRNNKKQNLNLIISSVPIEIQGEKLALVTFTDITKLKEAERKLKESEEKFRNMSASAQDAIIQTGPNGNIKYWNKASERVFQYTDNEILGKKMHLFLMPKQFHKNFERDFSKFIEIGRGKLINKTFEMNAIRKDRVEFPTEISISAFKLKGEWNTIVIIRDITKRKEEEKLLNQEKKFSKAIIRGLPEIFYIVDEQAKFLTWNKNLELISGYDYEELNKLTRGDLTPKDELKKVRGLVKEAYTKGSINADVSILTKEGKSIPYNFSARKIMVRGKPYLMGMGIDISEKKRAEENLKNLMMDLKRSNTELEQFAYVASHDLQEPLRMIASFTQLIERRYRDKIDEDANEFITFIVEGAKRLQVLINDLLAFSRVGTHGKSFKSTNINSVLDDVKSNLKTLTEESNAMISKDLLPVVNGDKAQLTQVFQNLISNAIKFHRGGISPQVHISGIAKKNKWIFSVKDNGIGIEKDNFDRIFVIFQRLHKRNEYGGTGIGLAICKKIIQRHGGKIWVESEMGEGSTFHFSISKRENEQKKYI